MNESLTSKMRNRAMHVIVCAIATFAVALTVPAVTAQSSAKEKRTPPTEWPTTAPYDAAIHAFDLALTEAARKQKFRDRLLLSSDSARDAVAEIGNMHIPKDRVMVFYEGEPNVKAVPENLRKDMKALWESRSSEKVHVFVLPPFDPNNTTKTYKYGDWFMCCYEAW
jgi:hypothetical protein